MNIEIYNTLNDLNRSFTKWLKEIMEEKESVSIALSGGSTPKSLFDYWATLPEGEINWKKIKFFWGDERCVPPTDEESNYRMTQEHLFDFVQVPPANINRIMGENEPEEEATRYGALLQNELQGKNGIPTFDIMMLGMGDDGHTASIFPYEMSLWESARNCVTATHHQSGQKRISMTGKVINNSKNVVFLITGSNKAEKVKEIISDPDYAAKKYPAARVQPETENLYWFIDVKAAQKLTGDS